MLLRKISNIL
ncbi:uncharacterized protein FFM5_11596 [Fusarium fujikuroi]|nr:uncharacterized protein FFM5_11596 [Fusarium fujikuroi]